MKITFVHRLFLYSAVLGYIILDMNVIHGPLRRAADDRRIDSAKSIEKARQAGIAALVLGRPITLAQIEYECREYAWAQGKSWEQIPKDARKIYRTKALNELIDHQIIRSKIKANSSNISLDPASVEQRWQEFLARFPSKEEMLTIAHNHGVLSEKEMRLRIEATLQQELYLARQFEQWVKVTDEQIQEFFLKHQAELAIPERIHVRHVYWATLDKDLATVKESAERALAALSAKEITFEKLATEQSEDENSKQRAGDIGWLTAQRTAADFYIPALALPLSQPTLLQTKLGWHIVEVLEKSPATPRTLEECRKEIRSTLIDLERKPYFESLRQSMRRDHKLHIYIYQSVIDEMP